MENNNPPITNDLLGPRIIPQSSLKESIQNPTAAPTSTQPTQAEPTFVFPKDVPVFHNPDGSKSYTMPDSYGWGSAWWDRRLFAETQGGAGYFIGGRTPTRIFYEKNLGDFQGSQPDPEWVAQSKDPTFVTNRVKSIQSIIGTTETILKEDYGDNVLQDLVQNSVSSQNESAKLAFLIDGAESKRRIEQYDATASWLPYGTSKVTSALGNYAFVDPITTGTMIATMGTGTFLPAARMTLLATRFPWLSTPINAARTFYAGNALSIARTTFALNTIEGGLMGYAMYHGYNKDQSIIHGDNAVLDTNPWDDIALGGAFGLLGGWMGYRANLTQIGRNAAIESVASSLGTIPHEHAIDFATKFIVAHENLLRTLKRVGFNVESKIIADLQDPMFLRNNGFRSSSEVSQLAEIVRGVKPDEGELSKIIAARLGDETNGSIDFRKFILSHLRRMKNEGINVMTKDAEGNAIFDFVTHDATIDSALRFGDDKVPDFIGSNKRLTNLGFSNDQIKKIYNWFNSRSGVNAVDFHHWLWTQSPASADATKNDINLILKFIDNTTKDEIGVINKHFGSEVDAINALIKGGTSRVYAEDPEHLLKLINIHGVDLGTGARLERSHVLADTLKLVANPDLEMFPIDTFKGIERLFGKDSATVLSIIPRDILDSYITPKQVERIKYVVSQVNKLHKIKAQLSDFERDFHINGIDLTHGYPVERINRYISSKDEDLMKQFNNILKDIEGDIHADAMKQMVDSGRQQLLRNDLLRLRLRNGIESEVMGFLNTTSHALLDNPNLYDGALPFRSRLSSSLNPHVEELGDVGASAHLESMNVRRNALLDKFKGASKTENKPWSTRFQNIVIKANENVNTHLDLKTITDFVNNLYNKLGREVTWVDLEEAGIRTIENAETKKLELHFPDGKVIEDISKLPENMMDDSGNIKRDVLTGSIDIAKDNLDASNKEMEQFYLKGKLTKSQYNAFIDSQAGTQRGGWSFAVGNAVVKELRRVPGIKQLSDLAEWSLTKSMDIQGTDASKLWFNKEYERNYRGMNAFEQVLFFANMIDSPHVLKRDFGNIIDQNLFSVQQLRNDGARRANVVVRMYKRLHAERAITAQENEQILQALFNRNFQTSNPANPNYLNPRLVRLRDAVEQFFLSHQRDIHDILVAQNMSPQNIQRAMRNIIDDNMIVFDKSRVIPNRNAVRANIGAVLERYANENIEALRNVGSTHLYQPALANPISNTVNNAIANATTVAELRNILRVYSSESRFGIGINEALQHITDAEVAAMQTTDDLADTLNITRVRRNRAGNNAWETFIRDTQEGYLETMDRTRLFSRSRASTRRMSTLEFAGIRTNVNNYDNNLWRSVMNEAEMTQYQLRNIPHLLTEYANNDGLNLRMQGQISRNLGDVHIFTVLEHTRDHLRTVAQQAEIDGLSNAMQRTEDTITALEDRMAHALGYQLEARPRTGVGESAFRLQNGLIRAKLGSFWGLQTGLAEIPRSMLLSSNRNGFVNAVLDLFKAIRNSDDLDDLGAAIEQYTHKYSLGVDNEAYAGNVTMNRVPVISRATGAATGINLNPVTPARRTFDLLTGRTVDPHGTTIVAERAGGMNAGLGQGAATIGARALDASVGLTESLANTNSRLGMQQYFVAIGKDIAVSSAKRQLQNNIDNLIRFSTDLANANIEALPTFNQRLDAFKALAKTHNIDWELAARLNHHGLLETGDLRLMQRAFNNPNVIPPSGSFIARRGTFRLPNLLDELENISRANNLPERGDDIATKLTSFFEESANSALNSATGIAGNPNASLAQRWLFQFSSYSRAFQHQSVLRGINDSTISTVLSMAIPTLVGEFVYNNARRMFEGQTKSKTKTYEQWQLEFENRMRNNPELALYETLSRIPVYGGVQNFMSSGINFLATNTDAGVNTREYLQSGLHHGMYEAASAAANYSNDRFGTNFNPDKIVSPNPNLAAPYMPVNNPLQFTPFSDLYKFAHELIEQNPYRNNKQYYYGTPTSVIYSAIPGMRTWEMQAALRVAGYPPIVEDPRVKKFDKSISRPR